MELEVLDYRLRICSIKKDNIQDYMHVLVKFGLLSPPRCRFFSLTETSDDFSVVIEDGLYNEFPQRGDGSMKTGTDIWVPLCVTSGAYTSIKLEGGVTNIAKTMIIPLADGGISIYNLSSYQTDYILVKLQDIDKAIECLSSKVQMSHHCGEKSIPLDKTTDCKTNIQNQSESVRAITHEFSVASSRFCITSIDPSNLSSIAMTLIEIIFYPGSNDDGAFPENDHFFSFSKLNGDITLVMSSHIFSRFPPNTVFEEEDSWRMVNFGDLLNGLNECGIVAQISEPIADANISQYYISTYYYGHCLVPEENFQDVLKLLKSLQSTPCQSTKPTIELNS